MVSIERSSAKQCEIHPDRFNVHVWILRLVGEAHTASSSGVNSLYFLQHFSTTFVCLQRSSATLLNDTLLHHSPPLLSTTTLLRPLRKHTWNEINATQDHHTTQNAIQWAMVQTQPNTTQSYVGFSALHNSDEKLWPPKTMALPWQQTYQELWSEGHTVQHLSNSVRRLKTHSGRLREGCIPQMVIELTMMCPWCGSWSVSR